MIGQSSSKMSKENEEIEAKAIEESQEVKALSREAFLNFIKLVNESVNQTLIIKKKNEENLYKRIYKTVRKYSVIDFSLEKRIELHYFDNNLESLEVGVSHMGRLYLFIFDKKGVLVKTRGLGEMTSPHDFMVSALKIRSPETMNY